MQRKWISLTTMTMLAVAACGRQEPPAAANSAPAPAPVETFKPVATVKQVMLGITVPASNSVFGVAGEAPKDDAAWQAVEANAMAVAESGNLLLMKPRAVDDKEWQQYAHALIDAAVKAGEAAHAKDAEKTGTAGDDLYNVCEQCHAKYMKKS